MNKLNLMAFGLMGLAFAACSSDEPNPTPDTNRDGNSFIAINVVNPAGVASRDDEGDPNDGIQAPSYENGTDKENKIENARCYFFDNAGNAVPVTADSKNWTTFKPGNPEGQQPGSNVEIICDGTVILQLDANSGQQIMPDWMVVLLNVPTNNAALNGTLSLAQLKDVVFSYSEAQLRDIVAGTNSFMMSNSVFRGADGSLVMMETNLINPTTGKNYIQSSQELAMEAPVDVYVERVSAKMRITATDNAEGFKFPVLTESSDPSAKNQYTFNDKKVFVKILGFVPTVLNTDTKLIKSIDASWTSADLGFTWNHPSNHRSYWATSVAPAEFKRFFSFNDAKADGATAAKYCLENTTDAEKTKMLVAAQIIEEDGTPMEISEFNGNRYPFAKLPEVIASDLQKDGYKKADNTAILPADISFAAVDQTIDKGRYGVSAQVAAGSYLDIDGTEIDASVINGRLALIPTMIWKNGYSYYYFDVKHYGKPETPGEFGVVRNHIYETNITDVFGLGTPVFDPELPIDPEKPSEKYSYLAAKVNILAWHIVRNNIILGK